MFKAFRWLKIVFFNCMLSFFDNISQIIFEIQRFTEQFKAFCRRSPQHVPYFSVEQISATAFANIATKMSCSYVKF